MKRKKVGSKRVARKSGKTGRKPIRRKAATPARGGASAMPRVIVKFLDGTGLPYDEHVGRYLEANGIGNWRQLAARYPGIRIRPMFRSVAPARLRALVALARRQTPEYRPPDFLSYFVVDAPHDVDPLAIVRALTADRHVQFAYQDVPADDPVISTTDPRLPGQDPKMADQGYLRPAPEGIDALYAWSQPGGDGKGQRFVDLEQGWTLDHEDLASRGAQVLFGSIVDTSRPHGTAVLGVVCAVANRVGCRGIAYGLSSVQVVSHSGNVETIADAIVAAVDALGPGGVLLLEVQRQALPTERYQSDFDAIELATAGGITVVAAAGNGGANLDTVPDPNGLLVLAKGARDSGAIIVGSARSASPHARLSTSNYGKRVDCYAWGENVTTTMSTRVAPFSRTGYFDYFDGTSAAAPIIAGAALVVQGVATARVNRRLDAYQMRRLLSDPSLGTPCPDPAVEPIGSMPDLKRILQSRQLNAMLATSPPPTPYP